MMQFDLRRPCAGCPFRTDCLPGWLGEKPAARIAESITEGDAPFVCHKTIERNALGERLEGPHEQHCAGALLVLDRDPRAGGLWANLAVRMAGFCQVLRAELLDRTAPVFASFAAFVAHHAQPIGGSGAKKSPAK